MAICNEFLNALVYICHFSLSDDIFVSFFVNFSQHNGTKVQDSEPPQLVDGGALGHSLLPTGHLSDVQGLLGIIAELVFRMEVLCQRMPAECLPQSLGSFQPLMTHLMILLMSALTGCQVYGRGVTWGS